MSYAYSALGSTVFVEAGYFVSVFLGQDALRLQRVGLALDKLPELFRYSSAIFVQSLATQMSGATQTIIVTRILGLDSVAVLAVTSRIPSLLMQLTWKPFDACVPHAALARHLAGADVFALFSLEDGFARTVTEAMVCGIPLVISENTGAKDFVQPSRWEALGLALQEALACGCPAVGTRSGGIPGLVEDGVNGFLVAPECPTALAQRVDELMQDS